MLAIFQGDPVISLAVFSGSLCTVPPRSPPQHRPTAFLFLTLHWADVAGGKQDSEPAWALLGPAPGVRQRWHLDGLAQFSPFQPQWRKPLMSPQLPHRSSPRILSPG